MQSYRRKCRKFRFVNSAPAEWGARTAAGVFAPNGRHLFLHRLSGVLEPRRRFTLTGGEFSAEMQRGVALCGARESAAPAAGAKRKGHLRFPFLFELLPFPCFLIWRRFPICDRCEMGERQSGYLSVSFSAFSQFTDSVLLHRRFTLHRRGIAVPRKSLARCSARHLRIKRLVQFILAGPVYHNALANCAALLCRACLDEITCVAVMYLTLRIG